MGGTFTAPEGAAYVRIQLISYMMSGWVAFDDISLTDLTAAPAQVITMTYDAENHMTGYSGGGTTATFVYDGDGKRVKGTVNGATTLYVGSHFEWNATTSTMKKYYFAGSQRIAVREGNTTGAAGLTFLFSDHLGSTSVSVNASSNTVTGELRYGAWGDTRITSGSTPTNGRYTGQYQEPSLGGLSYYGARWYDSSLGRFLSADTYVPESQGVQAWDRYAFVNNNPVNLTDPTGHFACGDGIDNEACEQYDPDLSNSGDNGLADTLSEIAFYADVFGAVASGIEAGFTDAILIPACATGAGCPAALEFDVWFASASTLGALENVSGAVSFLATAGSDFAQQNTGIVTDKNGNSTIKIGKDTVVSLRNAGFGLIPESNIDAAVSFSQLKYDLDRLSGVKEGGSISISLASTNDMLKGVVNLERQILLQDWW